VIDFNLPELGENITAGDVLRVLVKAGDTLAKDQPVLELETDKATIEVPSSVAGQVTDVKVKEGDKVKVGQAILSVEDGAPSREAAPPAEPAKPARSAAKAPEPAQSGKGAKPGEAPPAEAIPARGGAVAANSGEKVTDEPGFEQHVEGVRREPVTDKAGVSKRAIEQAEPIEATAPGVRAAQADSRKVVDITRGARAAAEPAAPEAPAAPAAPSVRRMARELGVDVDQVAGSGPDGRISIEDVKAHAKRLIGAATGASVPTVPLPDFSRWGAVERQPIRAVRRKTAEHLSAAWAAVPHVTQCDLADITALEEMRRKYAKQVEAAGGNLTVTAIALKIVAAALKVFPQFNASIDLAAGEIIVKKYVNVGVAVDTDRGLLVPVIRNADQKNIVQLSVELAQLSEKARTRKIALEEMQGGGFSISNLGGIGGTYFTPIVNAPEVAILGISRARTDPVYRDGQLVPRLMLPLSLSYDHRVIDGADGIRFLRWVAEAFEQPFLLALQG
jgi:pyruvate dehydrogenase E2 component (dihydrolipoamide acetyltransferase)